MSIPTIRINDYVSLAVMLLMIVALVGGQTDARSQELAASRGASLEDRLNVNFDGEIFGEALAISIAVIAKKANKAEPHQFRGEDE